MPDLRDRVEEERGLLKRIQLHVPGFAGYRRREDIRTADNMLRIQMANMIKDVRGTVEEARELLAEEYQVEHLDKVGGLIGRFQAMEGKVRHAEGGYSGISADIRIEEDEMNHLYEYDASMLEAIVGMGREATSLRGAADGGDNVSDLIKRIRSMLSDFADTFKKRMTVISKTEVMK